ncbi:MAG: dynamin family protein, partial [Pseudomonadota bacterium]
MTAELQKLSSIVEEYLDTWHSAKPVMALMGEFSSGKSTLANLLLGRALLPEFVTATNLPAVWLTYSETEFNYGLTHDGRLETVELEALSDDVREQYILLHLGVPSDLLLKVDMVDTPGTSDPKLQKEANAFLAPYIDFVVWCSSAIQAWRKTEKTAWLKFPDRLRTNSQLILTRADKVRSKRDLQKVLKRVSRETDGLFQSVLPLDTPTAMHLAQSDVDLESSIEWKDSGGHALWLALDQSIEAHSSNKPVESTSSEQIVKLEPPAPHPSPVELIEEVESPAETDEMVEEYEEVVAEQEDRVVQLDTASVEQPEFVEPATFKVSAREIFAEERAAVETIDQISDLNTVLDRIRARLTDTPMDTAHRAALKICFASVDNDLELSLAIRQIEIEAL